MALKIFKPNTPGLRGHVNVDRSELSKERPHRALTKYISRAHGRNHHGHITSRHRCAGHKKLYRIVDFKRDVREIEGRVERIEYDPNRTAYILLVSYANNEHRYVLAPNGIKVGDVITASDNRIDPEVGNAMPLKHIPVGTQIHNVELKIGKGGQMARSAGTFCTLMAKGPLNATIKLGSGETRFVNLNCFATIGALANTDHKNKNDAKAGRSRWKGIRPHVRGVAMNPVDHPMGGGEGKTSGGRHPVSPWGQKAKGLKTRRNKRTTHMIIRDRRKK